TKAERVQQCVLTTERSFRQVIEFTANRLEIAGEWLCRIRITIKPSYQIFVCRITSRNETQQCRFGSFYQFGTFQCRHIKQESNRDWYIYFFERGNLLRSVFVENRDLIFPQAAHI